MAPPRRRSRRQLAVTSSLVGSLAFGTLPAAAADLVSASFTLRGGHIGAGATALQSSPSFLGTAATGQSEALGLSGSSIDLTTSVPGFIAILVGALPTLDGDGDGVAFFLDDDDDGDGLVDTVETNTGIFVSAQDTGSDSLDPDSDGDGFGDGAEVAASSNPNDPLSTPGASPLPALGGLARAVAALALLLASVAIRVSRRSRRNPS